MQQQNADHDTNMTFIICAVPTLTLLVYSCGENIEWRRGRVLLRRDTDLLKVSHCKKVAQFADSLAGLPYLVAIRTEEVLP